MKCDNSLTTTALLTLCSCFWAHKGTLTMDAQPFSKIYNFALEGHSWRIDEVCLTI